MATLRDRIGLHQTNLAADQRLMDHFRSRPVVVVSPHYDDACFSLGCFLEALRHGTLVNVFTRNLYLPRPPSGITGKATEAQVHAIRSAEDRAFASRCGMERLDLGCEEPPVHGRSSKNFDFLEEDVAQMNKPLLATLDSLAAAWTVRQRGVLFCPLGIGRHVNHRATVETVLRAQAHLDAMFDIFLYEDQPYAHVGFERREALRRVDGMLTRPRATRFYFPLGARWSDKQQLIGLYPTQLKKPPQKRRFWPASLLPWQPHEAFWSCAGSLVEGPRR